MLRKINEEDIDHLWDTYYKVYGTFPLTEQEITRGFKKLWRAVEKRSFVGQLAISKAETRRSNVVFAANVYHPTRSVVYIHPAVTFKDLCKWAAYRKVNSLAPSKLHALEYVLAKRVCEKGWLTGALQPKPKAPKPPPTKEQIRKIKIARLEARRDAWESKINRAKKALSKINRSLNTYRRIYG
jgi:hypothetical protein